MACLAGYAVDPSGRNRSEPTPWNSPGLGTRNSAGLPEKVKWRHRDAIRSLTHAPGLKDPRLATAIGVCAILRRPPSPALARDAAPHGSRATWCRWNQMPASALG